VVNNKIFSDGIHQLHCDDWGIGSGKSISSFCCRLGNINHLYSELTVKKKKGSGERATYQRNLG
tara:strand:- start:3371 stop:3562 length:192 start_codon:yes stop_codon:yes gene_type:complete